MAKNNLTLKVTKKVTTVFEVNRAYYGKGRSKHDIIAQEKQAVEETPNYFDGENVEEEVIVEEV
tara:strand:- start:261 stop:452 length:192 start_codon:yes stop_codon:yes gene_type:complete